MCDILLCTLELCYRKMLSLLTSFSLIFRFTRWHKCHWVCYHCLSLFHQSPLPEKSISALMRKLFGSFSTACMHCIGICLHFLMSMLVFFHHEFNAIFLLKNTGEKLPTIAYIMKSYQFIWINIVMLIVVHMVKMLWFTISSSKPSYVFINFEAFLSHDAKRLRWFQNDFNWIQLEF